MPAARSWCCRERVDLAAGPVLLHAAMRVGRHRLEPARGGGNIIRGPADTVFAVLQGSTDPAATGELVAPDTTFVSLNHDDADLRPVMPWCGKRGVRLDLRDLVEVHRT